jgi:hypothetical protein
VGGYHKLYEEGLCAGGGQLEKARCSSILGKEQDSRNSLGERAEGKKAGATKGQEL